MKAALVSPAQYGANRANAQHSTGPVTEEGKAASSKNAFKHGFTGRFHILPHESEKDFEKLCEALRAEHEPATATERILIDNMAKHHWLVQRAILEQAVCFEAGISEPSERRLALMLRYQTSNERAFHYNLNQFLKLRKEREAQAIGFVSHTEKIGSILRKQEAEEIKVQLLRAKLDKVSKPPKTVPMPATAEIFTSVTPEVPAKPNGLAEKQAPAAA